MTAEPEVAPDVRPDAESASGVPPHRYTAALAGAIERRWQDRWEAADTFAVPNPPPAPAGEKFYLMDMFPYPSGSGLHVGHPLGFIGTDVLGRYLRMTGRTVLHTMGFDAFGLPAEQYAVQTGTHPRTTTEANIARYRQQIRQLGLAHDQHRSVSTTDIDFYRWTQWIFLQIHGAWYDVEADRARPITELEEELAAGIRALPDGRDWATLSRPEQDRVLDDHRLAYLADAPVNWCPALGTVLSNEEVTADGRSERGNFPVFRRNLRQWMMRITAYADRLADDLDGIDWPDSVKAMQRNWIGRSQGAQVRFASDAGDIEVFTTRPDTLFGATYLVLAPEHPMVDALVPAAWPSPPTGDELDGRWTGGADTPADAVAQYRSVVASRSDLERQEARDKTGVFTGAWATNPVNGEALPVFVADYVLMGYGTGAIMAVPGQDQRDWDFATVFGLPIRRTVQPPEDFDGEAYVGAGVAINSANDEVSLNGLDVDAAKTAIVAWLAARGAGESVVQYKLRDWLFSRQRYWGEPFPVAYVAEGETDGGPSIPRALPDADLPVLLPDVEDYSPEVVRAGRPGLLAGVPAGPRHRVGRVRGRPPVGPRARLDRVPARDQHDAAVGRLLLVLPALPRPAQHGALRRPRRRALLAGSAGAGRPGRRRPLRRRRRARGAAPALRALLAQGALRPRPRLVVGALPAPVQPGLRPGLGLHRRPRRLRAGRGGGRVTRRPDSRGTASPCARSTGRWASRCATW